MRIEPGRRFGPYVLERRVGAGGMGDVWAASHDRLRRPAVVKVIRADQLMDPARAQTVITRFEREAAATAALTSPHVVRLYDFGVDPDGMFFQVMELLEGMSLAELAAVTGPLPTGRVIFLLRQACEALGEAHKLGMIHRDIKPANLLVCTVGLRRDFLKVLDFGLVLDVVQLDDDRLTRHDIIAGTPGFIAPEALLSSDAVDARFDVYALGCVAYQLTAGHRVFEGKTPYEVLSQHAYETPHRLDDEIPEVPRDFADLVATCLSKDPAERPNDGWELGRLLARCDDRGWSDSDAERWWANREGGPAPVDEPPTRITPIPSAPSLAVEADSRPSLVVLPFVNRSGSDQEFFSEGLTEDLIIELSKIAGLFVISRNSAFAYRGETIDVKRACTELAVHFALHGTVRRAGERVRVTAELEDGRTGECLWAERYDRELTDIFDVQDDVVNEIVGALAVTLTPADQERRGTYGTDDMNAHDLFQRGRQLIMRQNRESIFAARELLQQAIDLDPSFAPAQAMFATTFVLDFMNNWSDDAMLSLARAKSLATSAALRDPYNADAHFTLGFVALLERRYDDAIAEGRTTTDLDPTLGHQLMANVLHYIGEDARGLGHLESAVKIDPHHPDITLYFLGLIKFGLGRYSEAAAALRERASLNPTSDSTQVLLAASLGHLGDLEGARQAWSRAMANNPDYSLAHRARVLPYRDSDTFQRITEGLHLAGIVTDLGRA